MCGFLVCGFQFCFIVCFVVCFGSGLVIFMFVFRMELDVDLVMKSVFMFGLLKYMFVSDVFFGLVRILMGFV